MSNVLEDIEGVDIAVKKWLEALTGGSMLAVQHGNQPDTKKARLLFNLINVNTTDFTCEGYDLLDVEGDDGTVDESVPHFCSVHESMLTYQVDAVYCRDGVNELLGIVKLFKTRFYRNYGDYLNLAYRNNGPLRRTSYMKDNQRHFKATVDIDFVYRCKKCLPINTIETVNLQPCEHIDFLEAIQISKS